jgi:hypothetical protein
MNGNYHVVKHFPSASVLLASPSQQNKEWRDGTGKLWTCWPLANEAWMSWEVRCRDCPRPAHWVGIASPFGDGVQYFFAADAYCYWCFPRTNFSEEELKIVSREDWARQDTSREILDIIRYGYKGKRGIPDVLRKLILEIEATIQNDKRSRAMLWP